MNRFKLIGYFFCLVAACLAFAGCKKEEIDAANAAAAAAAASPNPFVMGIGTLVSALLGSHFISKGNISSNEKKEFNGDEAESMASAMAKRGYQITRTSTAPVV